MVYAGPWAILWRAGVAPVFISWVLSPAVAAFSSALIFSACRLLLRARRSYELSLGALPFFVFATAGLNIWFSLAKGNVSRTASRNIGAWSTEKIEWVTAAAAGGCALLAVCLLPLLHLRIGRATLCLAIGAHGGATSRPWNAKDPTPRPDDEEEAAAATVAASGGGGPPSNSSSSSSTSSSPKRTLNPLSLAPARSPSNDASFSSRSKALVVASSGPESHYCGRGGDDDIVLHASQADAPFCGPIGRAVASFRPRDALYCVSYFLFHGLEAGMGNNAQAAAQASPRTKIPAFVRPLLALRPPPFSRPHYLPCPVAQEGDAMVSHNGRAAVEAFDPRAEGVFAALQAVAAACFMFAHGASMVRNVFSFILNFFLTLSFVGCLCGRPAGRHLAGGQHRIAGGDRCLTDVGHSHPRVWVDFRHRHLRVQADTRRRHQTCDTCGLILFFSDPNCFIPPFFAPQWLCSPRREALRRPSRPRS